MKTNEKYKSVNGTFYDKRTLQEVIDAIELARAGGWRVRLSYGDTLTGRDWQEQYGIVGRIGRSTGPVKVPILMHNRRSIGGPAILDCCIVRIVSSAGGRVLYQHPKYYVQE